MPTPTVLPFDETGKAITNRISGEIHTLSASTGRIFALNYGAFYADNLVVRDHVTNTRLNPITDYVCIAPYDNITRITGLEAFCVLIILVPEYQKSWEIDYSGVGGEYSTNVSVIRDVILAANIDISSVRWGDILEKPAGFNTAPHFVDFRQNVYGFEGLISSIINVADSLKNLSPAESAAILSQVQASMTALDLALSNKLSTLEDQVNDIDVPDTSDLVAGVPATDADIFTKNKTDAFLRASNIPQLATQLQMGRLETSILVLNTSTDKLISGNFNLRSNGAGDNSVPNVTLPYIVENIFYQSTLTPSNVPRVQVARCSSDQTAYKGMTLARTIAANGAASQWIRTDAGKIGEVNNFPIADLDNMGNWDDPSDEHYMSPKSTKDFMLKNSDHVLPIGTVIAYAGSTWSAGSTHTFFLTHGQAVSRSTHAVLYARLGTTFGSGNGSTTFNLPDLRGEFIRGFNATRTGTRADTGRAFGSTQNGLAGLDQVDYYRQYGGPTGSVTTAGKYDVPKDGSFSGIFHTGEFGGDANGWLGFSNAAPQGGVRPNNIAMHYLIKVR